MHDNSFLCLLGPFDLTKHNMDGICIYTVLTMFMVLEKKDWNDIEPTKESAWPTLCAGVYSAKPYYRNVVKSGAKAHKQRRSLPRRAKQPF